MSSTPNAVCLVAACLLGCIASVRAVGAAEVDVLVRSAVTGAPLEATLALHPLARTEGVTRERLEGFADVAAAQEVRTTAGRVRIDLSGPFLAKVHAPGHAPLATVVEPGAHGWTLWLTPLDEAQPDSGLDADALHLAGIVRNAETLAPLAGVELRLEPLGLVALSAADGAYAFEAPPPTLDRATEFLRLEAWVSGRMRLVDPAIPWAAGSAWRVVDLVAGEPARHRHQHPLHGGIQLEDAFRRDGPAGTDPDQPPLSVRVGFADASCTQSCCTASCTHVCVFDLETYVRRGITYEWIASWTQSSLRAGTVAYRSYGAWHALNPPVSRPFDLCSSACCQVNGPNVHGNGVQAARATAGLMMKRNGTVFRSEYSAENNCKLGTMSCSNSDFSCGDGYNGSPAANWPCLEDSVGLGRDCFGHGRGMSQWGTQRWSLTPHFQAWPWIVNHYYNANGAGSGMRSAAMTQVLSILDAAPAPASVTAGQGFEIVVEALNRAAESHQAVLIGASIRRGSDPFLSDPSNDRLLELSPGVALATRDFVVPPGTPPGSYALWVALYLDIDGNGAIGGDLAQALVQIPDALQVTAAAPTVFADGFEE
ncbi:MAG TPA: SpoIID/LytB domain-containing protein [Xanthomonadaceae bacterium]|nr:SpoIID/LytB domain-containing protein [Xanthomonadaceae bacterium]